MSTEVFDRNEVFVGRDYGGITYDITPETVATYIAGTGDDNPWYRGPSPLGGPIAPALILHSAVYRTLDWYLPNIYGNLHARQEWQVFAPVMVGERLATRAVIVDRYTKRDREYVVNEVLITDAAGRWLQRSRTHQSFLLDGPTPSPANPSVRAGGSEGAASGFVVDKDRERRADRTFSVGEGPGPALQRLEKTITVAMCQAFSGPHRSYHTDREMAQALGFPAPPFNFVAGVRVEF